MVRFGNSFIFFKFSLIFFLIYGTTQLTAKVTAKEKRPWTVIVFGAADNNLRDFMPRNLKQMAVVGSNSNVHIAVHVDTRLTGQKKVTRRYYVEKNNPVIVNITNEQTPMNSGDPQTLISACRWAINEYPADHYMLVLWNHGTGIIDPYGKRNIDTSMMYIYNPTTNNFELDRSVGYIDLIEALNDPKGICWDESTNDYLTNQKLEYALNDIMVNQLKGNKFDIIAFDACLMSMVEIAEITKRYAKIQISSQEVEPGPGWQYEQALLPFTIGSPEPAALARHIVNAFAKAYQPSGNHPGFMDFTQSALDLTQIEDLENNINSLGELLTIALHSDQKDIFKNVIAISRSRKNLTHFNEPTYVDLYHLYSNLLQQIKNRSTLKSDIATRLIQVLQEGQVIMKKAIIHSVSGANLPNAKGISIFFPERRIHPSYKKSNFAKNSWVKFLAAYLLT